MKDLFQEITIYHKEDNEFQRYNLEASFRNTSILNRNKTGVSTSDNALIRVFDVNGYNNTWKCQKGDVIVGDSVSDDVKIAPLSELSKKYGRDNVFEVTSIDKFIFNNSNIKELNHIKIGAK